MKKFLLSTMILFTISVSAQECNDNIRATTPTSRFIINADNTVTDKQTGLIWKRCSLGQIGTDCSDGEAKLYTWAEALNEVTNSYSGWRIPNIRELKSIVEHKCVKPSINAEVFPNTKTDYYNWSSSPSMYYNNSAWAVNFNNGTDDHFYKLKSYYIRLVRNTQ